METKKKKVIKHSIAATILIMVIAIVVIIIIKYQVNGETNMPFKLLKITIISTAEGKQKDSEDNQNLKWNFNINQNNDIYLFIEKNSDYKKDALINSVCIENINITKNPLKGNIKCYMPSSSDGRTFICDDKYLISDSLTYTGAKSSNEKNLEVCNQGGKILLRFANTEITTYSSNDDTEIVHNGTLLAKAGITNDDITFSVNFDLILTINNIKYKSTISLDLPYGNILQDGTTEIEKDNLDSIVFKRIN